MALRANAMEYNPPNAVEQEILRRLASLSAQLAQLRQTALGRGNNLGLGRGTRSYPTEGMSLALPREQTYNLEAGEMIPRGLLDGGKRRTKRSKRSRRTRRGRK